MTNQHPQRSSEVLEENLFPQSRHGNQSYKQLETYQFQLMNDALSSYLLLQERDLEEKIQRLPVKYEITGLKGHTRIGSKLEIKEEILLDHGDDDKQENTICKINNEHGNSFETSRIFCRFLLQKLAGD